MWSFLWQQFKCNLTTNLNFLARPYANSPFPCCRGEALANRRPDINPDFAGIYPFDWVGDDIASFDARELVFLVSLCRCMSCAVPFLSDHPF